MRVFLNLSRQIHPLTTIRILAFICNNIFVLKIFSRLNSKFKIIKLISEFREKLFF